jgi:hypothetical protein
MNQVQQVEWSTFGHFAELCRAERKDCPVDTHCRSCAKIIERDPALHSSTTGWRHTGK